MVRFTEIIKVWDIMSNYLSIPKNDAELYRLIELADYLMDTIGEDENNKLMGLLDTVGTLIAEYEKEHIPEPVGTPVDCLKVFMDEHGLKQKDLVEIGSPGVISEVMNGKRELNKNQIKRLSQRFNCSPSVFFDM